MVKNSVMYYMDEPLFILIMIFGNKICNKIKSAFLFISRQSTCTPKEDDHLARELPTRLSFRLSGRPQYAFFDVY